MIDNEVDIFLNPSFENCWCETCNHMPPGTIIVKYDGTNWCLDCFDGFKISPEEEKSLRDFAKKIQKLQKKLELENEEE